jgi:hypothetical protein
MQRNRPVTSLGAHLRLVSHGGLKSTIAPKDGLPFLPRRWRRREMLARGPVSA